MLTYDEMIFATLVNPPNPNEPLPPANRKATIYGTVLSFMVLAWVAVLFRLWVRIRVVKEPGLDDVLVFISAIFAVAGAVCVCRSIDHGLGKHMLYLSSGDIEKYLMYFYIEHSIYLMQTTIVKLALLLQFLRIFKSGAMRWTCLVLLAVVSLWGLAFSIMGWFPCFPLRGTWERNIGAKCYGFGFGSAQQFVTMFKVHSTTNMVLDLAIFLTPMVIFRTPTLKSRSLVAMIGLFAFGGIVVATSIWRLYELCIHEAATSPYLDFTWFAPFPIILSCLEVDFAIICASMPIFWPIIERSFAAIFVSYEVKVTEERVVDDYGLAYELEHTKSAGQTSLRSFSGTSLEGLTRDDEDGIKAPKFTVGPDPLMEDTQGRAGFQTSVQTKPKPKWEI